MIDCTKTDNYFAEKQRMTRTHKIYISKDKNKNQRFCYG